MKAPYAASRLLTVALLLPAVTAAETLPIVGATRKVIVTANRVETPVEEVASSFSVIEGSELSARNITNVGEALQGVAGLDVVRSGGIGGNTAVFIRGANSEHTLVLIDGVEANNPIGPTRAFNFADLNTANIDRIEILRGPQSTLYGSDALGGVINIITKRGRGEPSIAVSAEAGSYNTYTEQLSLSGADGRFDYSFGFAQQNTHGISAANAADGNKEKDGYENTAFSSRFGVDLSEALRVNLSTRSNLSEAELDNSGGAGGDDPNRVLENDQFFGRLEALTTFFDGDLRQTFGMGYTDQEFSDNNDPDELNPLDVLRSSYRGTLLKFDWQNVIEAADWLTIVAGAETERERGSSNYFSDGFFGLFSDDFPERGARTNGYFLQGQFRFAEQFFATTGIRIDDHSVFGSEVSWKIAPSYQIRSTGTKLSSTVGTGFKAPSLFQLYSSFGNPDLQPEESLGVDVGVEQDIIEDALAAGITYYWNRFDDLISFNPDTFKSENIARARTQGIEVSLSARPVESLSLRASYTLLHSRDLDAERELLRRPKHKAALDVRYDLSEQSNVGGSVQFSGKSLDNDFSTFPATLTSLSSYATVDLFANYALTDSVTLFARVENLFDREYEEVLGFGTRGAAAFGGIKVSL